MLKKRWPLILMGVLIFVALAVTFALDMVSQNVKKLPSMEIEDVDLKTIADGTYLGSYKVLPVSAEVRVTVSKNKITKIELLKHENGRGKPADVLTERVVQAQSLKVDTVSGATYSSKIILKAIQNALLQQK
jgi:uncharacterized protein with FMN-binding domain